MGEAKRRRDRGLGPRNAVNYQEPNLTPFSFSEAKRLTEAGETLWSWRPTLNGGKILGATTYITYRDDDEEEGDGGPWVTIESDMWDTPEVGEVDDQPMDEIIDETFGLPWYSAGVIDRFSLPDFSFHKLQALGCTHPAVLGATRNYDLGG